MAETNEIDRHTGKLDRSAAKVGPTERRRKTRESGTDSRQDSCGDKENGKRRKSLVDKLTLFVEEISNVAKAVLT